MAEIETETESPTTEATSTEVAGPEATNIAVAGTAAADATSEARKNARKTREGLVRSVKMDKTIVVAVVDRVRHPRYRKTLQRTKRLYAHDEANVAKVGDRVRVQETRPLSKLKRWRLVEVLERAR